MDVFMKSTWKLMGLCTNKKSLEILHPIHHKRLEVGDQSRGKDSGSSPVLPFGWLNKRHNRELIISSVLTLFSAYWIASQDINLRDGTLIWGLLFGIILNPIICICDWHSVDEARNSRNKILKNSRSPKMRIILSILPLIFLYLLFSQFGCGPLLASTLAFSSVVIFSYFKLRSMHSIIFLSNLGSWYGWIHVDVDFLLLFDIFSVLS